MLTVHHLNNSRSQRILWLLEELEVDYQLEKHLRDPKTLLAPKKLRDIHPLGKSPVITDGDLVVAESGAIIEYILDVYGSGRLRPPTTDPDYLRYRYWLHYAEGSAMTPFLLKLIFAELPKQAPFVAKPILRGIEAAVGKAFVKPNIRTHMKFWEAELEKSTYFVSDDFSAADIQMSFPLEASMSRGSGSKYKNISAFVERIHARPAYKRALEKGGPYEI